MGLCPSVAGRQGEKLAMLAGEPRLAMSTQFSSIAVQLARSASRGSEAITVPRRLLR